MIKYPFDADVKHNRFQQFLDLLFKDYPAFLWGKMHWRKVVAFPLLVAIQILKTRK
ncbi:hypothetical protein KA037_06400 [Patescibacteria group bacterium]|nr:hypothetical protein [Patescibacteria group bacterium]MBP7842243.1 hypothetical protein [Patescibacteria group bacterium]